MQRPDPQKFKTLYPTHGALPVLSTTDRRPVRSDRPKKRVFSRLDLLDMIRKRETFGFAKLGDAAEELDAELEMREELEDEVEQILEVVRRKFRMVGGVRHIVRSRGRPNARRRMIAKRAARKSKSARRRGARKARRTRRRHAATLKRLRSRGSHRSHRLSKRPTARGRGHRENFDAVLVGSLLNDAYIRDVLVPRLLETGDSRAIIDRVVSVYGFPAEIVPDALVLCEQLHTLPKAQARQLLEDTECAVEFNDLLERLDAPTRKAVLEVYLSHVDDFCRPWSERAKAIREGIEKLDIPGDIREALMTAVQENPFFTALSLSRNEELDEAYADEHKHQDFYKRMEAGKKAMDARALTFGQVGVAALLGIFGIHVLHGFKVGGALRHAIAQVIAWGKLPPHAATSTALLAKRTFTGVLAGVTGLQIIRFLKGFRDDSGANLSPDDKADIQSHIDALQNALDHAKKVDVPLGEETVDFEDEYESIVPSFAQDFDGPVEAFTEHFIALRNVDALCAGVVSVHDDGSFVYEDFDLDDEEHDLGARHVVLADEFYLPLTSVDVHESVTDTLVNGLRLAAILFLASRVHAYLISTLNHAIVTTRKVNAAKFRVLSNRMMDDIDLVLRSVDLTKDAGEPDEIRQRFLTGVLENLTKTAKQLDDVTDSLTRPDRTAGLSPEVLSGLALMRKIAQAVIAASKPGVSNGKEWVGRFAEGIGERGTNVAAALKAAMGSTTSKEEL